MALVMTKSNLLDIHANNMGNEERVTITQTEHSSYIYKWRKRKLFMRDIVQLRLRSESITWEDE